MLTAADFRNAETGDFRPKSRGVLDDHGSAITGWNLLTDLAGRKRVQGKSIDIGCYECSAAGLTVVVR